VKIGIYCKQLNADFFQPLLSLFEFLKNKEVIIWIHHDFWDYLAIHFNSKQFDNFPLLTGEEIPEDLDYMITIGGDGTFLEALTALRLKKIPLLGINTGRLGFLADITPKEMIPAIENLLSKQFYIEERSILQVEHTPGLNIPFPYALNDLTVHKRDTSSMVKIHASIDDVFLASYWADGLIIATPTGSTAYSMSAGGPIVSPDSKNFIITPISSHNLTVRPLVIPDHHVISLQIESRESRYLISLDSRSFVVEDPIEIKVKKSDVYASIVKFNHHNFYKTIRNKLMWGIDKRN